MLLQNCSRIHYPLDNNLFLNKKKYEWSENMYSYNQKKCFYICCFDYLINIEEYYSDNLMQNNFFYQFIKIVYDFDKRNIFDFSNYNKDSLIKFILILNKTGCFYYIQNKIKFSKYISNISVRILQNHFKKNLITINNTNKTTKKNNNISSNELKINNIISTIYNNACCNYFKTLSLNKSSKFLEYSNKNNEEDDIYNKLIYYNNALIITTKNKMNNNNIDNYIKLLNKLLLTKKKQFDNIYLNNNNSSNYNGSNIIKSNLEKNEENYKKFKLLSFIMYNYGFALENLLNQKKQAKIYYQSSYEYISKYLGKNSFEAQKFLFRIKSDKKNKKENNNFYSFYNCITENNIIIDEEKKRKNITPINLRGKNNENLNNYDEDIDLRLKNIMKKIEKFEAILENKEVLNNIILNEKNINQNLEQDNQSTKINNDYNYENKKDINKNISSDNYNSFDIKNNEININKNFNIENNLDNNKNKNKNDNNKNNEINQNIDNNIKININIEENKENNKKINVKEKITFDMMDNIIEEFKKESQEKLEQQKKLKEEKEKEKKLKEEEEKKEKEKEENSENKNFKIKIEKIEDKKNESPRKVPKIKKLFQKVLGRKEKEPSKTKLGELFQSLMRNPQEEKRKDIDEGGKEIKVGKESDNNFINLDDDEDEIKDDSNIIKKEEENINKNISDQLNNKPKSGFGYKINANLDNSEYSYKATTFYQENNML